MCLGKVAGRLPRVTSFLVCGLKLGCWVILVWTTLRSGLCFGFFMYYYTPELRKQLWVAFSIFWFYGFVEAGLFSSMVFLATGLYNNSADGIGLYLNVRLVILIFEIVSLLLLCGLETTFVSFYMANLLCVLAEILPFIVVFSLYVSMGAGGEGDDGEDEES